jgi:hypothetical protein
MSIGTVATIKAASPVGTHLSEMVTPPFPHNNKNAPMMAALFHVDLAGFGAPLSRAAAYMITPAKKNRAPAMRNGGMV